MVKNYKVTAMTDNTKDITHEREIILRAANWKSMSDTDPTYAAFCKVFEYRREISIMILDEKDDIKREHLMEIFKYCNKQISNILGL